MEATDGVLRGRVRGRDGSPLRNAVLRVSWLPQSAARRAETERATLPAYSTLVKADSAGHYVACGVPRDAQVFVVAADESRRSGVVAVRLVGRVVGRLDLVAADPGATAKIHGVVVRADRSPVAGALVGLRGVEGAEVRADTAGRFELDGVPQHSIQLRIRSIGLIAAEPVVAPTESPFDVGELEMRGVSAELEQVLVLGRVMSARQLEFEERRMIYVGEFYDEAFLTRLPALSAYNFPSTTVIPTQHDRYGVRIQLRSGMFMKCFPKFFIDGVMIGVPRDSYEEMALLRPAKRVEIYLSRYAPAQYADPNDCGAVVLWYR
jgi:hypothetical protein